VTTNFQFPISNVSIILLALALTFASCFEPQEGCLDIEATNFDASADKDCCCEYPQLIIEALHRYGVDSIQYRPDSLYVNDADQVFRIKNVAFYFSGIELFQGGALLTVSDTAQLQTFDAATGDTVKTPFTDDFLLIRRTPVDNSVGDFRPAGTFEKVRLRLGLNADAQRVIPRLAPSGSPLRIQGDSLWHGPDKGFVFFQAVVVRDSMQATVPDTISLLGTDLPDFFIEQTGLFEHASGGFDFRLRLRIDYKKMFEGIDWTTGDITAWKSRIVANLPDVFSVSQ
jgi:hypothetical protein